MNLKKEMQIAILAAKKAGKILLKYHGKKEKIKEKSNKSLVAEADLAANKEILKLIKKNFPKHSILSEETGFKNNNSDFKWIIDPLDGTHNFLHEIPIFGTSIALEYKNNVVLGVLNFPFLKIIAVAEKGKGAFLNGRKLKVSWKKGIRHAFILFEFSYSEREKKIKFLQQLVNKTVDVRNFGSAIYNFLLISSGKADGYVILSTNEWDVAAGFLIVEESGGKITDLNGKKYSMSHNKFIVSNNKIHKELLSYVNK